MHFRKPFLNALLFTLAFALAACHTVPETGRQGLSLVSEQMIESVAASSFKQMKRSSKISQNAQYNAQVDRVARAIVAEARKSAPDLPPVSQWEWVVFEDDETINAFAMPGGKIGVYSGMFKIAQSDDDLAVVLGHEVAHVAAQHGNERVSRALLLTGVGIGLGVATAGDAGTQRAVLMAYGLGSTVGYALPFSRRDESEADEIGLLYSSRAGYNPQVAISFWQRMGAQAKFSMPEFLSTHPSSNTRIDNLKKLMPRAQDAYSRSKQ